MSTKLNSKKGLRINGCVLVYILLACIGIWDSTVALILYTIGLFVSLLLVCVGLYYFIIFKLPSNKPTIKQFLFLIMNTFIIIIVLSMTEHWYVLYMSLLYIFLICIHLYYCKKNSLAPAKKLR